MEDAKWRASRKVKPLQAGCLEDITPEDIRRYILERIQQDGVGPKTANRMREVIHRLCADAAKHKGLPLSGRSLAESRRACGPCGRTCAPDSLS